jgi:iron-sulfur cluster assembly protein
MDKILPVGISEKAIEEIRKIVDNKKIPEDYCLRVGIKGGGCSGISFMLGFDKPTAADDRYHHSGLSIIVEKKHTMYLIGKSIDYHEGVDAVGFIFKDAAG